MAATTGLLDFSTSNKRSWHPLERAVASSAVLQLASMLMSAPAMKQPGFPDTSTADLAEESAMNFSKHAFRSSLDSTPSELTLESGESNLNKST